MSGFPSHGGGSGGGVWTQTGDVISPDVSGSNLSDGAGSVVGSIASALQWGSATVEGNNAVAFGEALAAGAASFAAAGATANGDASIALSLAVAQNVNDIALGNGSQAAGGVTVGSMALMGGYVNVNADGAVAIGQGPSGASIVGTSAEYAVAIAGATVNALFSVGIGDGTSGEEYSFFLGYPNDSQAYVAGNLDGAGTLELACAPGGVISLLNVATQLTVGAAGGAAALPLTPTAYLLLDVPTYGPLAFPGYAPV
jgi:hypothetical protein